MPKINIENINYIVTGKKEKIINLDLSSSNGPMPNVSFFTETDTAGSVLPNNDMHIGVLEPESIDIPKNTNVDSHGFVFLKTNKVANGLFDSKDVAMKSKVSQRLDDKNLELYKGEDFVDSYLPHLRKDPLGFVQCENFSYGMTDSIVIAPVLKMTSLSEKLFKMESKELSADEKTYSAKPLWSPFLNPYDKFGSQSWDPGMLENLLPIYTYTPLRNLRSVVSEMLSSTYQDTTELENKVSEIVASYNSFRKFICSWCDSPSMISVLFQPVYNFENIDHNYILEIPVSMNLKDNNYDAGTVYADMMMGKNIYDDLYDTNISSLGTFSRVREYRSIKQTGGKLFTTYFDDVVASSEGEYNNTYKNQTEDVKMSENEHPIDANRDYMKVECIDAVNRFVSTTKHKANVFTVKVFGLDGVLNTNEFFNDDIKKQNVKDSIQNSIRRIVTNFVPAHTQLFETKYETEQFDPENSSTESC